MAFTDKTVIITGLSTVDMTPRIPNHHKDRIDDYLRPGSTLIVDDMEVCAGGAVGNTGLAISIFGGRAELIVKVGNDAFGKMVTDIYDRWNDPSRNHVIRSDEGATSYTVVFAIPGIDRFFVHNPGINHMLRYEDYDFDLIAHADHFHIGYPAVLRELAKDGGRQMLRLLSDIKALGLSTSLDTCHVDPGSEEGRMDWRAFFKNVIPAIDLFTPSIEEICWYLHPERHAQWLKRAGERAIPEVLDIETDIRPLADEIMNLGAKILILKCGSLGMYYRTAGTELIQKIGQKAGIIIGEWADKEGFESCFVPKQIASATGCGDVSIAGFILEMLDGGTPKDCTRMATAAGACCIEGIDAQSPLVPFDQLKKRIADGWKKSGPCITYR